MYEIELRANTIKLSTEPAGYQAYWLKKIYKNKDLS